MNNYNNIINSLNANQRCQVWYDLNRWEWNELLGEKPENWDALPNHTGNNCKYKIIDPIMTYILKNTSYKKISKYCSKQIYMLYYHKGILYFYIWYYKQKLLAIFYKTINYFGIYTSKQRKMYNILAKKKEEEHQEEMRKLYGGGK